MSAPVKDPTRQTGNAKHLVVIVAVLLLVCGVIIFAASKPSVQPTQPQVEGTQTTIGTPDEYVPPEDTAPIDTPVVDTNSTYYQVTSVSDGDTIKVNIDGKIQTVRLIGVDTPETKDPRKPVQCFGNQASNFTTQQLGGTKVRLLADVSQQDRDKYGRLLRYVYMQNGELFNLRLIAQGFAYEYTYQNNPYRFQAEFRDAQQQAQQLQNGLWSTQTCNGQK